jgi:hypothetical protein
MCDIPEPLEIADKKRAIKVELLPEGSYCFRRSFLPKEILSEVTRQKVDREKDKAYNNPKCKQSDEHPLYDKIERRH